jgi:hypothetical protein
MRTTFKGWHSFTLLIAIAVGSLVLAGCGGDDKKTAATNPIGDLSLPTVGFHDDMRKLWEDHIWWTRLAILDIANNAPDTDATVSRLLQNQVDIGNAVKPYYGADAGDKLTALLKDHIVIAADLVKAAKAGDNASIEAINKRWQANADEIASFLATANPDNWKADEMKSMMHDHLDLTLDEASAYLKGDYKASIAGFEKLHTQALAMADMLSSGIERQFPQKFGAEGGGR